PRRQGALDVSHQYLPTMGAEWIGRAKRVAADESACLQDRFARRDEDVQRLQLEHQQRLQACEATFGLFASAGGVGVVNADELGGGLAAGNHADGASVQNVEVVQSGGTAEDPYSLA